MRDLRRTGSREQQRASFPAPWALVAPGVVLVLVLVVLGLRVRSMDGPLGVDLWISRHLVSPVSSRVLRTEPGNDWLARVGAPGIAIVLTMLTSAWAIRRRDALGGLLAVIGPTLAFIIAEALLKPVVGRRIGEPNSVLAFPSGTVTVVAASVAASVVLVHRWAGRAWAILAALILGIAPVVMSVVVVAIDWHYATDAIGGIALGFATVLAAAGILSTIEHWHPMLASASSRHVQEI